MAGREEYEESLYQRFTRDYQIVFFTYAFGLLRHVNVLVEYSPGH